MNYNTILPNDVTNGEGVCVSFFVQGCPHHCPGCFNPETWDFNGGQEYTPHTKWEILEAIFANNVQRNFSVLGGEPLALQNLPMVDEVITAVRIAYPSIKIFLWTGYILSELENNQDVLEILDKIDVLIDGPYIEEQRQVGLKLRGSTNQNIWRKTNGVWEKTNE